MLRSGVGIWPAFSLTVDFHDLPLVLAVGAVLMIAQVFLSRRRTWWPGLILPGVWFLGTLAGLIVQAARAREAGWGRMGGIAGPVAAALAIENLPALLLLAVFVVCRLLRRRKRQNMQRQLRKTRIEDM